MSSKCPCCKRLYIKRNRKEDLKSSEIFTFKVWGDFLEKIWDYIDKNFYSEKSEAIRSLIRKGLTSEEVMDNWIDSRAKRYKEGVKDALEYTLPFISSLGNHDRVEMNLDAINNGSDDLKFLSTLLD